MCGIAGIYSNKASSCENNVAIVKDMLGSIEYRGPDESGIYSDCYATLGSVRLSIVDIESGQQPFFTNDRKYWIVYNGEIFNFIELRTELTKKGVVFRTKSDTEVLLHAYIRYGPEFLSKLNGQFAFAIWDIENRELFLARDRVGIRPLFYSWLNETFIFGSEIKAIFEYPGIRAEIDSVSLMQVFTAWTTLPSRTIFKNIVELPPGHYMKISRSKQQIYRYWTLSFPDSPEQTFRGTFEEAKNNLEYLLSDATSIRLRADVPVAAYLSGGIDSGATTSFVQKANPDRLQTFSIGFEDAEFDETPYQQEVSHYLQTKHTNFYCTTNDIGKYFPRIVWHSEIPVLRTAPVPMFCLSGKVRENGIKVVVTGEGADEMLGGYDIFKEGLIREFWSNQPDSHLRPLLFDKLYPYLAQFQGRNKSVLRMFYGYKLSETDSPFYSHLLRWHNTSSLANYLNPDFRSSLNGFDFEKDLMSLLPEGFECYDTLGKSQWLEIILFMSGYLLSSQGDRVAMANSVEGRYPFLDYRVIEFAASLPSKFKIAGLNEKYILKKMMEGRLPESVLKRPKQAYRAPMASGFFSSEGKQYLDFLTGRNDIQKTGIFNPHAVTQLIDRTLNSKQPTELENMALSAILSTQILYHQFVLKDAFRPVRNILKNCVVHH